MKTAFFILFFCTTALLHAQQIANVRFEQVGEKVVIHYDITESEDFHLFEVTLRLSTDGGKTYGNALQQVSGDVGRGIKGGNGKQITWRAVEEVKSFANSAVRFKVEALQYDILPDPFADLMVRIEGGTFQMGSDEYDWEKPIHTVTVNSFYMGKYEVTQKEWRDVMGSNPSYFSGCDNCPVENVSWNDVQEFLKKLNIKTGKNYRLPTEAEWEYAARSGQNYLYAGSYIIGAVASYLNNNSLKTSSVGQKLPNSYGLYDMSGNVWEWCSDWYNVEYYQNSPSNNPKGPSDGSTRVLRGGSWYTDAARCRVTNRSTYEPNDRANSIGFRLVF